MLGAVVRHHLAHLFDQRRAVFAFVQVDEVDHDDTAHIPQAQLPCDLGRRRQVDVHGRLLLVVVHFGAVAAVDVHHV